MPFQESTNSSSRERTRTHKYEIKKKLIIEVGLMKTILDGIKAPEVIIYDLTEITVPIESFVFIRRNLFTESEFM